MHPISPQINSVGILPVLRSAPDICDAIDVHLRLFLPHLRVVHVRIDVLDLRISVGPSGDGDRSRVAGKDDISRWTGVPGSYERGQASKHATRAEWSNEGRRAKRRG